MKYKIGKVDVEAVQWNGNNFGEIVALLLKIKEHNITTEYNGSMHLYIGDNYIHRSQYIVISKESHFVISEQDFHLMATKVKEPKFKVGDKVYLLGSRAIWLDKVTSITTKEWYILDSDDECEYEESELLTLKEAIEKLKEL